MTALHFFYQRSPYGGWMPVTSPDHPDTLTRDGHKIITTGHVELTAGDLGLTLHALAKRYPAPGTAPEILTGPDQAEPRRQAVEIRVPVRLAREVLQWMGDEMARMPEDTAYQRDLAVARADLLAEIERLDRAQGGKA